MVFQKMTSFGVLFAILVIAVTSGIFAEEFSFATKPILNDLSQDELFTSTPLGHVEDISLSKVVSSTGTIAIDKITFTVVADEPSVHLFQICAVIEGPPGIYSPPSDNSPACTTTELLQGNKSVNQSINFLNAVNVSDLVGISFSVDEI